MCSIMNMWLILFWLAWLLFFLNTSNLIKMFVTSELIWLIIYIYSLLAGLYIDELTLYMFSLFIITIASVEFSIGFILIIFFKKIFKTVSLSDNSNTDWTILENISRRS